MRACRNPQAYFTSLFYKMNSPQKIPTMPQSEEIVPRFYTDYSVWAEEYIKQAETRLGNRHSKLVPLMERVFFQRSDTKDIEKMISDHVQSLDLSNMRPEEILRMSSEIFIALKRSMENTCTELLSEKTSANKARFYIRDIMAIKKGDRAFAEQLKEFDRLMLSTNVDKFKQEKNPETNAMWRFRILARLFRETLQREINSLVKTNKPTL